MFPDDNALPAAEPTALAFPIARHHPPPPYLAARLPRYCRDHGSEFMTSPYKPPRLHVAIDGLPLSPDMALNAICALL